MKKLALITSLSLLLVLLVACGGAPPETPPTEAPVAPTEEPVAEAPTQAPEVETPTEEAMTEEPAAEEPAGEKTLSIAYQADITTFDPDNGFEVAGLGAIAAVYEGLVEYAPGSTELVGLLAEEWTLSDDELTYTFNLRDGVTFHDGTPMTSAEVKAAFERRSDESLILSYFFWNVQSFETPDPDTLVVTLGMPQPSFLDTLASPWGPKVVGPGALVDNAGDDLAASYLNENADGTGPFVLESFNRGDQYVLSRFADYWGEPAYFDRVEINIVPEIGQQVLQLQNGDLDMVLHGYPFTQLAQLPEGFEITTYNDLGLEMAFVNSSKAMGTPEICEAVKTAINPELWVADAFGDYASPALSLYPKAMLTPAEPVQYPTDMEAAQAAIAAAGDVAIEIGYAAEEAGVQQRVADLLVAQLAAIGVNATARAVPQDESYTFFENLEGAPDLYLAQNNPDAAHPETQATLFYTTGAPLNIMAYSNPEADDLIFAAGALIDKAERDAMYAEGGALLFEGCGFLPLADVDDVIVHRAGLTNLNPRPAIPWNVDLGTIAE
ncbi:MAG: ABC transporter substrate-binding protein [Anaerolineae bacterium]|nr:ABC transporter substrate-binding protein [Anaerolineae bacterium]